MLKINELSKDPAFHTRVKRVTADSRQVGPGTIFVAVSGVSNDGHEFVAKAADAGALLIVGEKPAPRGLRTPYLRVTDSRLALAELAADFHDYPSHHMLMIGVTGTSGKTTTSYLIESILEQAGHRVGVIGTVNFRNGGQVLPSTHTTPGAPELQELLARMKKEGCTAVVMEVSSHALKQHRASAIAFDGMVFTNLSAEHLDYHPTMEDYFLSKKLLFTRSVTSAAPARKSPVAAINVENEYGRRLSEELQSSYATKLKVIQYRVPTNLRVSLGSIEGELEGGIRVNSELTGAFNASNIAAASAVSLAVGVPVAAIESGISKLKAVPGRMERVPGGQGIHVLVDYAHKPDALEKVLQTLGPMRKGGRIITVFGCGGDRDRSKRPVMGRLASEMSDEVIVTSDNPRGEDPRSIIDEITAGMGDFRNFSVEPDRAKAIDLAIRTARVGDIVLIAGKGHEDYQIIGDRRIHFDDREVAASALDTRF